MKKSPNHKIMQSPAFCEIYWELYEIDTQCGSNWSVIVLRWKDLFGKSWIPFTHQGNQKIAAMYFIVNIFP